MPYLVCEDFKFGLDTRKFMLNSPPGTLTTLSNAHITPGGEIEKRKAFTRTALPSNSFGLEVTDSGFVVFGSVAEGSLNAALPSGYTYQRLQHPDGTSAMTAVIHSTVYNGKAFVVADYGAGGIISFYDGTVVDDLSPGKLASVLADADSLAAYIAGLVNGTDDYTATVVGGTVTIESVTAGTSFSVTTSNDGVCTTSPDATGELVTAATLTLGIYGLPAVRVRNHTDGDVEVYYAAPDMNVAPFSVYNAGVPMNGGDQIDIAIDASGNPLSVRLDVTYANGATYTASFTHPGDGTDHRITLGANAADITTSLLSSGVLPVSGVVPQAQFNVTAVKSGGSGNVTSIKVDKGGANETEILGANVAVAATTAQLATDIKTQINTYCVANNLDFTASVTGSTVVIRASDPATYSTWTGKSLTIEVDADIAIGKLGVGFSQLPGSAVIPTVTSLMLGGTNILTSASITGTSLADFVSNLAADIDPASGYLGVAVDEVLFLSRIITSSSDAPKSFNCVISDGLFSEVTGSGGSGTGGSTGLYASIAYTDGSGLITSNYKWTRNGSSYKSTVQVAVTGGTPPYSYQWNYGTTNGVAADSLVVQQGNFPSAEYHGQTVFGVLSTKQVTGISCKVTDAVGNTITTGSATISGITT